MMAGVRELWAETTGDPRVVVAVLDGPVDRGHRSLAGARLEVIEAVAPSAPERGGPATRHGTAVASLIFGRHGADSPARGMAPGCRGLVVPIFGDAGARTGELFRPSCSPLDLARAILMAVEGGASIINISAGQYGPAASAEPILAGAVARAIRRGVLVVAAAGNDGCECSQVPAALPGVLAVGAMDARGRPLESSNWGGSYRSAGLLAPGADLVAALAGGDHIVVAGTSFAAAIVSGAAALLWSLALRRGRVPRAAGLREILLDSANPCLDDSLLCRRHLAGRLDLVRAARLLRYEEVRMSEEFPMSSPADEPVRPAEMSAAPGPVPGAIQPGSIAPSAGCDCPACQGKAEAGSGGCTCPACQARAAAAGGLVFALGQVSFDLISEARRDSIAQHMGGPAANPWDAAEMLAYLKKCPWEAASIAWTLNVDRTPLYAIAPAGSFSGRAYEWLGQFLDEQLRGEVELVAIAGRLAGRTRLFNGQVVPVVIPELRGMSSWSTGALVRAVVGEPPPDKATAATREAFARKEAGVRNFLHKVYYELRNLGVAAEERAINFAATNAFEVGKAFEAAHREAMELDTVEVERSTICRPESDCWDVKIYFFYPERQVQTVRKVYRFTVDVSDVVPVTVGPLRSWFVR
jgi:cyanobactin maturation PatA/PatG family protease